MIIKDYITTIELFKESMKFSSAHMTLFSQTEREPFHGHTYQVYLAIRAWVDGKYGMTFDYRYYKHKVLDLCKKINQTFLMPQFSPYLSYKIEDKFDHITFNNEEWTFAKQDITWLPVTNITVEELSRWFVEQITENKKIIIEHKIESVLVKVFSGPGQSASYEWQK